MITCLLRARILEERRVFFKWSIYIDGLVQERRNSIANALELLSVYLLLSNLEIPVYSTGNCVPGNFFNLSTNVCEACPVDTYNPDYAQTSCISCVEGFVTYYVGSDSIEDCCKWPYLTHWSQDKMAAIFQTTSSNAFSWMKMYEFRLKFHWSLFPRVQLTICHHWFR